MTAPAGTRPRVWLVAGLSTTNNEPHDMPVVRDDLMRRWYPDGGGASWHTADGRHHATWTELHTRFDLVEVA